MILNVFRKIPFLVPLIAGINIIIIKILESISSSGSQQILWIIRKLQFNHKSPFYFNYWVVYIMISVAISIVLILKRETPLLKGVLTIGINFLIFLIICLFIANRM